ncbi:MAG: hypothetical protein ACR2O4_05800 [Hyphomicrobiaceae bacterium]
MMIGTILAQSRPANTTAVSAYSPPNDTVRTEITLVTVCNTSGASAKYRIFIDDDGTTYDETTALFWDIAVAADTSVEILLHSKSWWMTNSSGNLAVRTDTASAFTFTVFGMEHQV